MRRLGSVAAVLAMHLTLTTARAESVDLGDGRWALEPITHGALTVVPVVTVDRHATVVPPPDLVTLDEAAAAKTVAVQERNGGEVNRLIVKNTGKKPLLILAGEVVKGGRQDRILGEDLVIAPGKSVDVQAFCVEHGRWRGGRDFSNAGYAAHAKVRFQAKKGNQSGVWQQVDKKLDAAKATSSTAALREAAEKPNRDGTETERAIQDALTKHPQRDRIVGFAAIVGGQVVSLDTFAHPALAKRYRDKLVKSYVLESIGDSPAVAVAAPTPIKPSQSLANLMTKARAAKTKSRVEAGGFAAEASESDQVVKSEITGPGGVKLMQSIQQE